MVSNSDKKTNDLLAAIKVETLPHYLSRYKSEVVWSPNGQYFALAYTIAEASMCNELGHFAFGRAGENPAVFRAIDNVSVDCNFSPWCRWLSETCFVFGTQLYIPAKKNSFMPIVAIDVYKGHHVFYKLKYNDYRSLTKVLEVPEHFYKFEDMPLKELLLRFSIY